jgi:hypothetical protein
MITKGKNEKYVKCPTCENNFSISFEKCPIGQGIKPNILQTNDNNVKKKHWWNK